MNSQKKIINELRFQLESREVKDQHYPVQLSASDANAILALLKERDEPIKPTLNESHSYVSDAFKCGKCGHTIRFHAKYCEECGHEVAWDD